MVSVFGKVIGIFSTKHIHLKIHVNTGDMLLVMISFIGGIYHMLFIRTLNTVVIPAPL